MSKVELVSATNEVAEVAIIRIIKVGRNYRINSSYGYAGISSGVVVVEAIISPSEAYNYPMIDEFKRIEIDNSCNDPEVIAQLDNDYWVQYSYADGREEQCLIPLSLFIEHMSLI